MEMEEAGSSSSPDDAVLFFGVSLVLGIGSRHLLRGTRVPYTVALLVLGVALGGLEYGTKHGLGKLGAGIRIFTFMGLKYPAAGAGAGGSHGRPASA